MHILTKDKKRQTAFSSERNRRVYDFLKAHPIGTLASVDPNGNPHAAVIYFAVDENFDFVFMTKRDTKKHDNLQHNNHVMLVSYEASSQTTVQITGSAKEIHDNVKAQEAFSGMLDASKQTSEVGVPPLSKLYAGYYVAYQLKPVQIRMAMFIRPDPGGYDMYEIIDFIGQTAA